MKLLMVSGTYNEKGNIDRMIHALLQLDFSSLEETVELEYLIIDDASPDGTAEQIRELQKQYEGRLHLIEREGKLGLGSAYARAFQWALQRGDFDAVCQIDADFSHSPDEIPKMLKRLLAKEEACDFVIGSRYVKGGDAAADWRRSRKALSRLGSLYAQIVMELHYKDITGGFNMWKTEVLASVLEKDRILSDGFFFQLELKYKASRLGFTGAEHPIHFAEREIGYSKMNKKILFEALFLAHKVSNYKLIKQFILFSLTGVLGTLTNLGLFYFFADIHQFNYNLVSLFSFWVAASQNFLVNSAWTFKQFSKAGMAKRYFTFLSSSLLGFAINLLVLNLVILLFHPSLKSIGQMLGILSGLLVNFTMTKLFVFKKRHYES